MSPEEQEAAAFLRERFLYLIASLPAKSCSVSMYNHTEVSGHIRTFDLSFENVLVENLKPPNSSCIIPKAQLRTSDILTLKFQDI